MQEQPDQSQPIIDSVPGDVGSQPDLSVVPDVVDTVPGTTDGTDTAPEAPVAEQPVIDNVPVTEAPAAAPEAPTEVAPVIDSAPGVEASDSAEPNRDVVTVPADASATLERKAAEAQGLPVIGPNGPEQTPTTVDPGQIESPQQ